MRVAARPACLHREWWLQIASLRRPGRVCGPDLASMAWLSRARTRDRGGREGGACAFERGMSVLPSASPMYSVCGNSPAAEAPASARSRRCPIRGCSRWHKQGQNTRRLEDQGGAGGPECLLLLLAHDERGIAWLVLQPGSSTTVNSQNMCRRDRVSADKAAWPRGRYPLSQTVTLRQCIRPR